MIASQMGAMGLSSFATNIHSAVGPSAAGRAALVQDLMSTSAINHSLPPSKAGVPSAVSTAKPATVVKAGTTPAAASSSNETVYIAAAVAALLVVGVVAVKLKKKKKR